MGKYVKSYSKFIFEQAFGAMDMPAQPQGPAPKKEKPFHFIFIDDLESMDSKKYPDGSLTIDFPTYSTTSADLDDWVKKNIVSTDSNKLTDPVIDLRRKNIIEIVKGNKVNIAKEDIPFIEKLKNAVSTDIFGRREPDSNIIFTHDGTPTTDDVNVTFIKYKK